MSHFIKFTFWNKSRKIRHLHIENKIFNRIKFITIIFMFIINIKTIFEFKIYFYNDFNKDVFDVKIVGCMKKVNNIID